MIACNPVKRAFKPKYIEETKTEFFSRGLCIVDTQTKTVTVHDSVVFKDTVKIVEIQEAKLKMFTLDTIINGAKVTVQDGKLSLQIPDRQQVVYKVKTVTKIVKDLGLEKVLRKTISTKDSVLLDTKNELADIKQEYYKYKFLLYVIGLIIVVLVGIRVYSIFKV